MRAMVTYTSSATLTAYFSRRETLAIVDYARELRRLPLDAPDLPVPAGGAVAPIAAAMALDELGRLCGHVFIFDQVERLVSSDAESITIRWAVGHEMVITSIPH